MEEPGRLQDSQSSRKRHRSDDMSAASFRLTHSAPLDTADNPRQRPSTTTHHTESDNLATSASETPPVLEPLHPPIPNFSAISQAPPRPNSTPHPNAEPPGGMVYNIALPLPNPGRAHRFCQACDHINHVRRKLCTNCGAPKPSAVRNAVGVRSITEVENSADRRHMPDGTYRSDYIHSQMVPGSISGTFEMQNRVNNQPYSQNDPRVQKPSEHAPHQARSLAMKCPGDDIPLLGNTAKQGIHFSTQDTQTSRGFRSGQALLCEPLVNFNTFQTTDRRLSTQASSGAGAIQQYGNHVDINHHNPTVDREQYTLPSMQGIQNQKHYQGTAVGYKPPARPDMVDGRIPRNTVQVSDKLAEEPLADDVLSLNRGAIDHGDSRQVDRRYPNVHGLRHTARELNDQNHLYGTMPDAHGNSGLLYKHNSDMFPVNQQYRNDDRDHLIGHDGSRRDKLSHGIVEPNHQQERVFHSQQMNVNRHQELGRASEQPLHSLRNGLDGERLRQTQMRLQKPVDQVTTAAFEESNRHPDEGRFALENILMQHKTARHS